MAINYDDVKGSFAQKIANAPIPPTPAPEKSFAQLTNEASRDFADVLVTIRAYDDAMKERFGAGARVECSLHE